MIGRGALLNPWIFSEIELSGEKRQARKRTEVDVADVIEKYLVLLREELQDKAVIGRLKQFICQVTKGLRGGAAVRRDLCTTPGLPDFMEQLARWSDTVRSRTKMGPESLLWAGGSVDA
ncbi:MAG TPA: tRNA-dihydrouridine synthase, partial [Oligoflexia bacterium]|nr:tRNA-dihydrouridine synthase [Oligoflexia bacterium]